jgi:hypothetical protein
MARGLSTLWAAALASVLVLGVAPCHAQSAEFGKRDELVLSVERIAGFQSLQVGDGQSVEGLGFHPYFWGCIGLNSVQSSGLSLGVLLGATHIRIPAQDPNDSDSSATFFQARPRVGYAGWLDSGFGYWLRVGPTAVMKFDHDAGDTHYAFGLGAEAYVVFRAAEHVAILAGPHVDPSLIGDKQTDENGEEHESEFGSYGLTVGIAGEFF